MTLATVDRYDPDRVDAVGDRAVVLGGSVAGLAAARVLADAFTEVVIIERDPIPDAPIARDGAPQTHHPHVLLEAGRATFEDLFPGFGETLLGAGGLLVDVARDVQFYEGGGLLADGPERLPMYCASRPLLERVLRQHAVALDGVTVRGNTPFLDYRFDDGSAVIGVTLRDSAGTESTLDADLVVDAMGRTSRTPTLLEDRGYPPPPVDDVDIDVQYTTVRVERPPDSRQAVVVPPAPQRPRGGAVVPIEDDTWEVIFQGVHGEDPPTDREALLAFAESLPVNTVADILTEQSWVDGTLDAYPFPSSRRRRFEALDRFPDGLVVTGDAIASFNPVYGQGLSAAALDAVALHHALADGGLAALGHRHFEAVEPIVDAVWQVAVGSDFSFPATDGPKPAGTDLFNWYVSRLVEQAHDNGALTDAYFRVFRLERPPSSLLRPSIVAKTLLPFRSA